MVCYSVIYGLLLCYVVCLLIRGLLPRKFQYLLVNYMLTSKTCMFQDRYLTDRYEQLIFSWVKRMEKTENSAKRR